MLEAHLPEEGSPLHGLLVISGQPNVAHAELRALGFHYRKLSGAKARGGPGHRIPGCYVVSAARLADPLFKVRLRYLLALKNGGRLRYLLELRNEVERQLELRRGCAAACRPGPFPTFRPPAHAARSWRHSAEKPQRCTGAKECR
jgi:hypothetical protein